MSLLKKGMLFTLVLVIFFTASCIICSAKENGIPDILLRGLVTYKAKGADAAMTAWIKGSPIEGDKTALSQANIFRQIESLYGAYIGYDLIRIVDITPSSKLVYIQMNFEKGPVFASFLCYLKKTEWIIENLDFNTAPDKILPSDLLFP